MRRHFHSGNLLIFVTTHSTCICWQKQPNANLPSADHKAKSENFLSGEDTV
ncbi:hypothetical protein RNAN_0795 [Rheinheimera nanhaiensis E407-8]|uniref:Uncharacterized protein n=1 Tax=Rheinheimera nanhaiensis E407-8 TaxID=562729 RepID=I1DUU7_9GAMM|nr:hypothetical protein RNAN_0795 [Rheinheimera nanhaiensis E407-8]